MDFIFQLKYSLHKSNITYPLYLSVAFLSAIAMGLIWASVAIRFQSEIGILIVAIGLVQGFFAWFFMRKNQQIRMGLYSIFFSLLSMYIAKYTFYFHFFHWQSAFYIDKTTADLKLLISYLQMINRQTLGFFVEELIQRWNFYDVLWIMIVIASAFEYRIWSKSEKAFLEANTENKKPERTMIKRRFGY